MKKPFPPRSTRSGSEGLRISQEIAAIQTALNKQGYRTRKQPKQAVWKVFTPPPNSPSLTRGTGRVKEQTAEYYLLTYQPAPISAWVLHRYIKPMQIYLGLGFSMIDNWHRLGRLLFTSCFIRGSRLLLVHRLFTV